MDTPEALAKLAAPFFVYILKCADGTFYTGVTNDIARRVSEHNTSTKGAKYTRVRRPLVLAYSEEIGSRSDAQKRESEIKKLRRHEKELLVQNATHTL
jgi:putative endonuclease